MDRYRQIRPKILFTEIEALYAGKKVDLTPKATQIIKDLLNYDLQTAVLLPSSTTGAEGIVVDCPIA